MKYKLILSIVVLIFSSVYHSFCQDEENFITTAFPPSPEAASLGVYGSYNVSEATGRPNISIPIWELKAGDFTLPISLSYNSGGIKVEQIASRVGLGWSLNAGGVITRTIRDKCDVSGFGYCNQSGAFPLPEDSEDKKLYYLNMNNGTEKLYDKEPDLFNYNVNGYSGSFIFDNYGNVHQIPETNLEIVTDDGVAPHSFNEFKIITTDGVRYIFNKKEYTSTMNNDGHLGGGFSAWYLSEIRLPNNEVINFYYTFYSTPKYFTSFNQTVELVDGEPFSWRNAIEEILDYTIISSGWRINKISYKGQDIVFKVGSARRDLPGDSIINRIEILYNDKVKRVFDLSHSYLYGKEKLSVDEAGAYPVNDVRLVLDSIEESNGSKMKRHSFDYFTENKDGKGLPSRKTEQQDLWGFYTGNDNTLLIPAVTNVVTAQSPGSRKPELTSCRLGTLKRINYPTGGYTDFHFELHEAFDDDCFCSVVVGGLRVKNISSYDYTGELIDSLTYSYKDKFGPSGINYTNPALKAYDTDLHCDVNEFIHKLKVVSRSRIDLSYTNGSPVTYENVKIENNDGTYKILGFKNLDETYGIEPKLGAVMDYGKQITSALSADAAIFSLNLPANNQTYLRAVPDFVKIYRKNSILAKSIIYTYDTLGGKSIYGLKTAGTMSRRECSSVFEDPEVEVDFYYGYYQTFYGGKELSSKTETEYDINGDTISSHTIDYVYNNDFFVKEKTTTNSKGEEERVVYNYPGDYLYEYQSGDRNYEALGFMCENNMINKPVEAIQYNNNKVTSVRVIKHKKENDVIVVDSVLAIQTNKPIEDYVKVDLSGNIVLRDSRMETQAVFSGYDDYGNITEYKSKDGVITSIVWGYNNAYPIAKAENASHKEVYFSSMEYEEGERISMDEYRCGRMSSFASVGSGFSHGFKTTFSVDETILGGKYIFSGWVKTPVGFSASAKFVLEVKNSEEQHISGSQRYPNAIIQNTNNEWQYFELVFDFDKAMEENPDTDDFHLSGYVWNSSGSENVYLDDIRFYPSDALMTTYTYDPLIGVTSETNPNGIAIHYEYDDLGRLECIFDNDGNVLKKLDYNYKGQ